MPGEILMVGSVPLASADEVLRMCGEYVGPYVSCLPDGEFGPRTLWIGYLARNVYDGHPDIETVQRLPESRAWSAPTPSSKWRFRIKPGVKQPRFETGYAEIAVRSYADFKRLRAEGVIPKGVRFQVCLPSTGSAFITYFEDPADWPAMTAAYEDAFRRDIGRLLEDIPADDLAIQIDICPELRDMLEALPWSPPRAGKFDETVEAVARLSAMVPDAALLGHHWCYGTLGGWPMVRIENLELCTRLTNAAVKRVKRRVDYVHMPVLRHVGDDYFAALRDLDVGDTKVYLGLIHHTDGVAGFRERTAIARRHLKADFGVASVCGYGRLSAEDTRKAFEIHRAAGAELRAARRG
jgi:hypothetical protein